MTKQFQLKLPDVRTLPYPLRILLNPLVLAAIGLHALLLFYPFGGEKKPVQKVDKKEEPVKLTQLSKTSAPPARPKIKRQLPPRPQPPVTATPPKPGTPGNPSANQNPLADFPHFPGAQPDCFGKTGESCRFTSAPISAVASHFQKALPVSKYKFEVDTDNPDVKIFRVTKGNLSFYLSILTDSPQTVYFLQPQRIDRAALEAIKTKKVAQIPSELDDLLNTVAPKSAGGGATQDATSVDFGANAGAFFGADPNNPSNEVTLPGIHGTRIASGQTEGAIVAAAKSKFQSVNPIGTYGGGNLYELKKGAFTGYLSVVQGKPDPLVVIWLQRPQ
jgi:hypothetical protein